LAPANEQLTVGPELADVAGVEPAVLERARGLLLGAEVAFGDVLAAHEDLAVVGDLDLHAGDCLADRAAPGAERLVQRDDRCGFRQAIPLNHRDPALAPVRLELCVERRRADDEGPELPTEHAMDAAMAPPSPHRTGEHAAGNLSTRRGRL